MLSNFVLAHIFRIQCVLKVKKYEQKQWLKRK